MIISCDIDGVISSNPALMQDILKSLRDAGYYIAIISGGGNNPSPSGNTWQSKCAYLKEVGVMAWDELVVVEGDVAALKAQWCKDHDVKIFMDNNTQNAKEATAAGVPLVLVPWASREK